MAKQLNVALNISANTKDAKKNLEDLSSVLNKISVSTKLDVNDDSLKEAKQAAIDLQQHLNKAINTDTGKLDLNKFSQSLAKSGQDLQTLHNKLVKIGPDGQQAFLRLAQSIAQADSSALNLGAKLSQLMTTLKNTARWQISSSILHGFMGALQGAYGYAQDLNQSLNNIRIVTGQSIDQMARFADEANRAAKALSTSTTAYTDAALIYYQQGLGDQAVKERTETTLKLSNVSRQSAEEVSSQMTAIWNNFDDGSKKLEYYADVITALGAATAASSAEISDGIQKFAAVADTVGLSYEKATAALATVVAETRQSADVVGTAFKTMFARFQGLELGETLEDGVTLNKYSEAIAKVGVNILEANGSLKDMDTILDELGAKWNTIGNAEQVALAETVAGTRQYAQFMAIMENYDKILANQGIAEGSGGTLQKQADIYAESWEAASKRVRAAAQDIYQDLLDDKFFITLLNGFEKLLGGVENVIQGMGGLKGILLLVSSIFMQHYAKEIPKQMEALALNIGVLSGAAEKRKQAELDSLNTELQEMPIYDKKNKALTAEYNMTQAVVNMTAKLNATRKTLSSSEIEAYETKIRMVQAYGKSVIAIGEEINALEEEQKTAEQNIRTFLQRKKVWNIPSDPQEKINQAQTELGELRKTRDHTKRSLSSYTGKRNTAIKSGNEDDRKKYEAEVDRLKKELDTLDKKIATTERLIEKLNKMPAESGKELLHNLEQQSVKYGKLDAEVEKVTNATQRWQREFDKSSDDPEVLNKIVQEVKKVQQSFQDDFGIDLSDDFAKAFQLIENGNLKQGVQELLKLLSQFKDVTTIDNALSEIDGKIIGTKQKIIEASGAEGEAVNKLEKDLDTYGDSVQEAAKDNIILTDSINNANDIANEQLQHTIAFSEAVTQMTGMVTQLAMSIQSIQRLGNIWNDDSLSDGEKLLQTATSLSMILPVLTTFLKGEKVAQLGAAAARMLGIKTIDGMAAAEYAKAAADKTIAVTGYAALGPLLLFVAIAGGAIALIMHLAKVIETPTEKLKRLKKEQEELNEAVSEAKQKWEDFNNTISNYDEALKGLSKLTEGTTEFNEKLTETNELAKQLIKTLSLKILEDYFINDQGAIVYTAAGRAKINDAQKQGQQAQAALDWASLQKENQVEEAEYYDKLRKRKEEEVGQIREAAWTDYLNSSRNNKLSYNEYIKLGAQARGVLGQYRDSNGNVQSGAYSNADVIKELKEWAENQRVAVDQETIKYILGSIRSENQAGANFVFNYDDEILHVAQQLDSTKKLSSAVAKSIFNNADAIQQAQYDKEQEVNELSEPEVNDQLEKLFGYLGKGGLQKLIDNTEGGAKGLLTSALVEQQVVADAQSALDNVSKIADEKFSEKNKDTLINIINGQLEKISPEDIKDLKLKEDEKTAF